MDNFSRRDSLKMLTAGMAGLSLAAVTGGNVEAQGKSAAQAFRGQHQPKPLGFDPAKLKGLSEKLIRSHWENNYGGAVRALNALEQRLDAMMKEKDLPPFIYGPIKREELVRTGSVVLHEKYFGNLGGNGKADGAARKLIEKWFGSYEAWEAEFKRIGNALSGGSGAGLVGQLRGRRVEAVDLADDLHELLEAHRLGDVGVGVLVVAVLDVVEVAPPGGVQITRMRENARYRSPRRCRQRRPDIISGRTDAGVARPRCRSCRSRG